MLKRVALSFAVMTAVSMPGPVRADCYERPCYPRLEKGCLRPAYGSCVRCAPSYSPRDYYAPRYSEPSGYYRAYSRREDWYDERPRYDPRYDERPRGYYERRDYWYR